MQKLKRWLGLRKKEAVFGAIIFLASSLSFGLGYLANREFNHASIVIEACAHPASSSTSSK
ncbi:MAG: hypothetical protein ABSE18_02050 [Minisyncoccia bacterium]